MRCQDRISFFDLFHWWRRRLGRPHHRQLVFELGTPFLSCALDLISHVSSAVPNLYAQIFPRAWSQQYRRRRTYQSSNRSPNQKTYKALHMVLLWTLRRVSSMLIPWKNTRLLSDNNAFTDLIINAKLTSLTPERCKLGIYAWVSSYYTWDKVFGGKFIEKSMRLTTRVFRAIFY